MIAILGAMQEEITPILEMVGEYKTTEYANNKFYEANYKGKDLVIAYSKIGKVNAAITATLMIEKFKASKLLFTGVAGSLDESLKIGDMLYATSLVQHDLDITAFGHPYGSGIIATGDQFICDNEKKEWIKKIFNASATEMEGASVALVCETLGVPFFILRAISDGAGNEAEFDFDKFLQDSANVSAKFILEMVESL